MGGFATHLNWWVSRGRGRLDNGSLALVAAIGRAEPALSALNSGRLADVVLQEASPAEEAQGKARARGSQSGASRQLVA